MLIQWSEMREIENPVFCVEATVRALEMQDAFATLTLRHDTWRNEHTLRVPLDVARELRIGDTLRLAITR